MRTDEEKQSHYATEFHALNAKRRAADLPPVTESGYQRLKEQQASEAKAAEDAEAEVLYICEACHKTFGAAGQFQTHNSSKRHREKVKEIIAERKAAKLAEKEREAAGLPPVPEPTPVPDATLSGAAGEGELMIGCNHCLFCWKDNGTIEDNLRHMQLAHSFYVPDVEHCTEPEGLVEYLHSKIIEEHLCLWCTGSKKYESPEAARQHMTDKAHCAMRYEEEGEFDEYEQFYDYDTGSEDEDEGNALALVLPGSEQMSSLASSAGDLPLPGGGVARHRALMKYYRQNIRPVDERRESLRAAMSRLALDYKASGGERHLGLSLTQRFNMGIGTRGNRTDASDQRRIEKQERHFKLQTGMSQNKIMRRWYRIQAANTLS